MSVINLKGRRSKCLEKGEIYIGRRINMGGWHLHDSDFANPFKIGRDGERDQVLELYEKHLLDNNFIKNLFNLILKENRVDFTFACWCKPDPCHGDILLKYLSLFQLIENYPFLSDDYSVPGGIEYKGKTYMSTEHFLLSNSFLITSPDYAEMIRVSTTIDIARALANRKYLIRDDIVINPLLDSRSVNFCIARYTDIDIGKVNEDCWLEITLTKLNNLKMIKKLQRIPTNTILVTNNRQKSILLTIIKNILTRRQVNIKLQNVLCSL